MKNGEDEVVSIVKFTPFYLKVLLFQSQNEF